MAISEGVKDALERASWIRRMFEAAIRLRRERPAESVADLSLGNPVNQPPEAFFESLADEIEFRQERRHNYMTNCGYPAVREAVAEHLQARTGLPYETEDICMTVGAAGALNVLFKTLLDPGDEVVILSPYFVEYRFYVENFQSHVVVVPCRPDFLPDVQRIADACTARTKAVLINSPNNPTGRVYPGSLYADLGRQLAGVSAETRRPIVLVVDDPYHRIFYGDAPPPEPAKYYDQVAYLTSFSKEAGLAGERIGYLALHPGMVDRDDLREALPFAMRALGHVNAPALLQRAVTRLLDLDGQSARDFYAPRRALVEKALREAGFEHPPLEGAFYAFPRAPDEDDVAFCQRMLDRGLVLVPGSAFGTPGHVRLSYAVEMDVLERGLNMLLK